MVLQTKTITANGANGHHKFTLTVTENSTSTTSNTSSVSWSFVISPIVKSYDWISNSGNVKYSVVVNGNTYSGAITTYDGNSTVTIKSGTETCTHNNDGSKTISFSFSITDSTGWSFAPGNASASGTMALTQIPRKATITSAPNFTDVENPTIKYYNPAGNAVSGLAVCISLTGEATDIAYRDVSKTGTSYTFNLTEAERNVLRNATSGNSRTVYFYLRTIIGDSREFHPKAVTFSISNGEPIVTASVVDTNSTTIALTGDKNKLVKYYSNAQATMTATAQKGASIDESLYIIRNGNKTGYGKSYTFNNVDSNTFTFSAEDSRGNVGTTSLTPTMVAYIKPTCHISNNRPDALGNMTVACSGNYFNGSFGAVSNTLTVQYRYKVSGGTFSSWANMTATKSGNTYYASADFSIPSFSQSLYYVFETRATDKLSTATSAASNVKSTPIFHWGESDFVFEVPVTFNAGVNNSAASTISDDQTIDGDLNVTGNLRLKGSGNYGNRLRFGDGDYCYIDEPSDDVMTIHAKRINLDTTNGVYLGSYQIPNVYTGSWTPSLNSSAISSYSSQYGWYTKIGQVVSVGFHVKATCRSGYDSTAVTIGGLPYVPSVASSGGGMCSGVHTSAGFNFQCYVAETSGTITTRVQSCNNTTATSLSTSASGCWYRSGGGEITLSGTITYMTSS
jgi:hypothetical protein